jgi:hypothetical protein
MPIPRRKVKNHTPSISPSEKKYKELIESLNEKIKQINDSDYLKFRDYSTRLIKQVGEEIKRKHFKDRTDYGLFKESAVSFIYKKFFYPADNVRIYMKTDNFNYINKTFNDEGKYVINKIISTIDNSIVSKSYNPVDVNSIYNETTFNEALKELEIDSDLKRISFSLIKKQYDSRKEFAGGNMELKDRINKAFILLRDQYEDYLKHTLVQDNEENNDKIE